MPAVRLYVPYLRQHGHTARPFGPSTPDIGAHHPHPSSASMQCSYLHVIRLCSTASRRYSTTTRPAQPADDFLWFPRFFDLVEQHALLSAALRKLDAAEPRVSRRRRRDFLASRRQDHQPKVIGDPVVENAFLPDDLYHFEEVRSWRLRSTAGKKNSTSPPTAGSL